MRFPLCLLQTRCRVASPARWRRRASEAARLGRYLPSRRLLHRREVLASWALLTDLLTYRRARGDICKHGLAPRIHETLVDGTLRHSPSLTDTAAKELITRRSWAQISPSATNENLWSGFRLSGSCVAASQADLMTVDGVWSRLRLIFPRRSRDADGGKGSDMTDLTEQNPLALDIQGATGRCFPDLDDISRVPRGAWRGSESTRLKKGVREESARERKGPRNTAR